MFFYSSLRGNMSRFNLATCLEIVRYCLFHNESTFSCHTDSYNSSTMWFCSSLLNFFRELLQQGKATILCTAINTKLFLLFEGERAAHQKVTVPYFDSYFRSTQIHHPLHFYNWRHFTEIPDNWRLSSASRRTWWVGHTLGMLVNGRIYGALQR